MNMIILPSLEKLERLILHQVKNFFFLEEDEASVILQALPEALLRSEYCFSHSSNKYYWKEGEVTFSIFHSGQYCIFLYFLARQVYLNFPAVHNLADKLYYLNKALNGLDLFYEVEMPAIFHLDHPVGTVIGRARYGEGFQFTQLCTVGNNKGHYPKIGCNVVMLSGAKILGKCTIGDGVIIAANAYVKDTDIPDNHLVFGSSPNLVLKLRKGGEI